MLTITPASGPASIVTVTVDRGRAASGARRVAPFPDGSERERVQWNHPGIRLDDFLSRDDPEKRANERL